MGIVDAFKPEDRTEITYSNFYSLIKQAAKYEIVMNAVDCNVPHRYIRETMTGKKEEEVAEMTQTAEGVLMKFYGKEQLPAEEADRMIAEGKAVETKPFNGTGQHTIEKANQEGEKDNGKNESEI